MMGAAAKFKLMSIGITVLSFAGGLIFFYITSQLSNEHKKAQIEEVVSQLINFVIFIWVGKIILNFSVFIKDPLAILAYPGDSYAFYIAILLSAIVLFYKKIKRKFDMLQLATSLLPVFLMASFLYEFILMVSKNNLHSFESLALSAILLVLFLIINSHLTNRQIVLILLVTWSIGIFILIYIRPIVTIFGYMIAPWFIILFLFTNLLFLFFGKKLIRE